jgi:hypothetical protein
VIDDADSRSRIALAGAQAFPGVASVMRGLQDAGVLTGATAHFDVLKVPHHGSDRNVTVDFFRRLPADHYIVSGNGKHGNPELETLRMLAEARGAAPYTVHFTLPRRRAATRSDDTDLEGRAEGRRPSGQNSVPEPQDALAAGGTWEREALADAGERGSAPA